MLNSIIRYFDLQSAQRDVIAKGQRSGGKYAPVLPQYFAASSGVIVEPLLRHYLNSGSWAFDWATFGGRVIFGLIVGVIILPGIYKSSFDPTRPVFVQLAALFPLGIGWQSIFASATKIAVG